MNIKEILDIALWGLNMLFQPAVYNTWDDKFARKESKRSVQAIEKELSEVINWNDLTDEDCDNLRFGKWEKDSPLRLIPLYLFNLIPIGYEVIDINGKHIINDGTNLDNDIRLGCTAYGIIPKDKK